VGVTRRTAGTIHMSGQDLTQAAPEQRAAAGIGWVPQERNIFKSLTVLENLTAVARPGPWTVSRVFEIFPHLSERRKHLGDQLSGGEQQMLAIGRALILNPKVILLDEPTEGLAPLIVEQVLRTLGRLFKSEGLSAIVVEQHARKVLTLTDKAIILDRGTIVHQATSEALKSDNATLERFLGVSGGKPSKSIQASHLNSSL
jgi:branched-chain amino acid transport system ATP-binding protein